MLEKKLWAIPNRNEDTRTQASSLQTSSYTNRQAQVTLVAYVTSEVTKQFNL
jgi:hypothetical protein